MVPCLHAQHRDTDMPVFVDVPSLQREREAHVCRSIVVGFLGQHGHSAFQVQITSSLVTYRQQDQSIEEDLEFVHAYIGSTERVEY